MAFAISQPTDLVEKLQQLIHDDKKEREETENDPSHIWHNGIEHANMEEYRKCLQC